MKRELPTLRTASSSEWLTKRELKETFNLTEGGFRTIHESGMLPSYTFLKNVVRYRVSEMKKEFETTEDSENWLTTTEFAKLIRVHPDTIRRALCDNENDLPHIRIGGVVRIDKDLAIAMARRKSSIRGTYKRQNIGRHTPAYKVPFTERLN